MPTQLDIPSRREVHCEPCEHHKCTGALCGPAHGHSWRRYSCMHPDSYGDMELSDDQRIRDKQIILRTRLTGHGRDIGKTELQPVWCPLKRAKE